MPSFCIICKRVKQNGDELSFHKFPFYNDVLLQKWVQFVSETESIGKKSKKITRYSSICSQHFLESDFSKCHKRKFLKKTAVPSLPQRSSSKNPTIEEDEPVEIVEMHDPLNTFENDFCGLCRGANSNLVNVGEFHLELMRKILIPLIKINENSIQKLCSSCVSILSTFSSFMDKICPLEISKRSEENENFVPPCFNENSSIKVEPLANIEEEKRTSMIKVINFSKESQTNHFAPPKKCEILEIVDIKPFNFGTLQTYEEDEIQILSPKQLKVELTDPDEDDSGVNELEQIRNYVYLSTVFLQDHNYVINPSNSVDQNVKSENEEDEILSQYSPAPQETVRVCNLCSKIFNSVKKFLIHKIHAHQSSKLEKLHLCIVCSKTFTSESKLKQHKKSSCSRKKSKIKKICSKIIKQKKLNVENSRKKQVKKNQKEFSCPTCGKIFSGAKNLYQHKISHTLNMIKCSLCEKQFKRPHGLRQHVKSIHEKVKNHVCPICNYSYLLKADMSKCRHSKLKKIAFTQTPKT